MTTTNALLDVQHLQKFFPVRKGLLNRKTDYVRAVDDVSFTLVKGETLSLVGESGSGKTTVGRAILRAVEPDKGQVIFWLNGERIDIPDLQAQELRVFRKHMQMIFQDPYSSLNPRMTVRDIIADPLIALGLATGSALDEQVVEIARLCQLNVEHLRRFPHAFSGGQRQRINIARALVTNPEFIVCDEAVSALDVSIRAEIINILKDLQAELGLTYLFIAHDLNVVEYISDRVAVMYLGKLVEVAPTRHLFENPLHPYSAALLSSIPVADPRQRMKPVALQGEIPNPINPPTGCHFHPRCPFVQSKCRTEAPRLNTYSDGHAAACHFADTLDFARGVDHAHSL